MTLRGDPRVNTTSSRASRASHASPLEAPNQAQDQNQVQITAASSLYGAGMDLKALQELLGHQWLSTTSGYIHVRSEHVELAWRDANQRVESRFAQER